MLHGNLHRVIGAIASTLDIDLSIVHENHCDRAISVFFPELNMLIYLTAPNFFMNFYNQFFIATSKKKSF